MLQRIRTAQRRIGAALGKLNLDLPTPWMWVRAAAAASMNFGPRLAIFRSKLLHRLQETARRELADDTTDSAPHHGIDRKTAGVSSYP